MIFSSSFNVGCHGNGQEYHDFFFSPFFSFFFFSAVQLVQLDEKKILLFLFKHVLLFLILDQSENFD